MRWRACDITESWNEHYFDDPDAQIHGQRLILFSCRPPGQPKAVIRMIGDGDVPFEQMPRYLRAFMWREARRTLRRSIESVGGQVGLLEKAKW